MFGYENLYFAGNHRYTFAVNGIKAKSKVFFSRASATKYLYEFCGKHGLTIKEVWNDHHDKTYKCGNGISIVISRM